jgi:hypothetical protein
MPCLGLFSTTGKKLYQYWNFVKLAGFSLFISSCDYCWLNASLNGKSSAVPVSIAWWKKVNKRMNLFFGDSLKKLWQAVNSIL